jgi:maleate isomerase
MLKKQEVYEVPYGYRAKIGLVVVGPNLNPTPEICRMIPDYIQVRETRIHMDPVVNVEECSKLSEPLGNAAGLLAEGLSSEILGNRSAIAFACTAGSLVGGPGWDKKEIEMMEDATADFACASAIPSMESQSKGIPCTTTATAAEEAMRFMGFKKIVIAGPYIEEINERFRVFYEDSGFQVLRVVGLGPNLHRLIRAPWKPWCRKQMASLSPVRISGAVTSLKKLKMIREFRSLPPIRQRPGI